MRGHVIERRPGVWRLTVSDGFDEAGQRRRVTRTVTGSKRDAQRELTKLLRERDEGKLSPSIRSEDLSEAITAIPFESIAAFLSKGTVLERGEADGLPYIVAMKEGHLIGGAGHDVYVRGEELGAVGQDVEQLLGIVDHRKVVEVRQKLPLHLVEHRNHSSLCISDDVLPGQIMATAQQVGNLLASWIDFDERSVSNGMLQLDRLLAKLPATA